MKIIREGEGFDVVGDVAPIWVGYGAQPPTGFDAYFAMQIGGFCSAGNESQASGHCGRLIVAQNGCKPQIVAMLHEEERGRLQYIDGCSDTILIYPPRKGDPCVNYLHIPPGTKQTMHTHPSARIGLVVGGAGRAVFRDAPSIDLVSGMAWYLPKDEWHAFETDGEALKIIAYHPDSDWGPTDEVHPMKNRTLVDDKPIAEVIAARAAGSGGGMSMEDVIARSWAYQ